MFEGKPTNPIPQHGPLGEITGSTTGDQEVAHIALGVNGLADFALFAPLITRSRFVSVLFSGANVAGLFLAYGWCNAVLRCRAEENVIGFFFTTAANNINGTAVLCTPLSSSSEVSNAAVAVQSSTTSLRAITE